MNISVIIEGNLFKKIFVKLFGVSQLIKHDGGLKTYHQRKYGKILNNQKQFNTSAL